MARKRARGRPSGNPARAAQASRESDVVLVVDTDGGHLEALEDLVIERRELDAAIAAGVAAARADGETWGALGRALGVSPQAVQKRYGRSRDD